MPRPFEHRNASDSLKGVSKLLSLNFGRNQSTGRYQKGTPVSDIFLPKISETLTSIKESNNELVTKLNDINETLKKTQQLSISASNNREPLREETQSYVKGTFESIGAILTGKFGKDFEGAGTFSKLEGIFKKNETGQPVKVLNWDEGLGGTNARLETIASALGATHKEQYAGNIYSTVARALASGSVHAFDKVFGGPTSQGIPGVVRSLKGGAVHPFGHKINSSDLPATETPNATPTPATDEIAATLKEISGILGTSFGSILGGQSRQPKGAQDAFGNKIGGQLGAYGSLAEIVNAVNAMAALEAAKLDKIIELLGGEKKAAGEPEPAPPGPSVPIGDLLDLSEVQEVLSQAFLKDVACEFPQPKEVYSGPEMDSGSGMDSGPEIEVSDKVKKPKKPTTQDEYDKMAEISEGELLKSPEEMEQEAVDQMDKTGGGKEGPKTERGKTTRKGELNVAVIAEALSLLGPLFTNLATALLPTLPALGVFATEALATAAALGPFVVLVLPLTAIFATLAGAVLAVIGVLLIVTKTLSFLVDATQDLLKGLTKGAIDLVEGFSDSLSKLAHGDFWGAIQAASSGVIKAFDEVTTGVLGFIPVLGGLADSVLKLFTGVLQAAISALTGFAATMIPFVEKISPATVQNYQTQLNNLIATIGVAFQGFVATAADLIQRTAGVILPLAEELAPIFSQLADIVRSGLLPIIKVWVALFSSIATVLGSAMGGLRDIVIQTVRAFVILAASVARLLGATDFLERLREAINRPEGGGAIAAQPATITNFEEIGRSLAAAAATASVSASGAEAEAGPRVEDLLGDILERIEVITPEAVAELVGETFTELWENTVEPRLVEMGQQIEAWWASDGQQQFRAILVSIIDEIWNAFARWLQNQAWFRNLMPGNGPIPTSQELRNASASILLNPGQAVVDSALYWFSPGN